MRKSIIICIICFMSLPLMAQSVKELQKQQQALQEQLQQTNEMLQQTKKDETATENKLNLLNADIKTRKQLIGNLKSEIRALDGEMNSLLQKRTSLQMQLEAAKDDYALLIRETHYANIQQSPLLFLLSAKTFQQLIRRVQYMRQFAKYRKEQVKRIETLQVDIDIQNYLLAERKISQASALESQQREQNKLTADQRKQENMLAALKKQQKDLLAKQKKQQKKVDELNKEIEKKIAQQVRDNTALTKEQQLVAGGFEENQGRLPWPVEKGYISGRFGKHQHPIHANVTVNNKGIYIQTIIGSQARAIYEGVVTWCAQMNGSYAVIIQHGNYRTVYSQLKSIKVKQGDKVQAKEAIGEILTNTNEDNKTELYFQIYKDRTILDPSLWITQ